VQQQRRPIGPGDQPFASTLRILEAMTAERTVELLCSHVTKDPGVGHDDLFDPPPDRSTSEGAPEVLDVRELGHGYRVTPITRAYGADVRTGWPRDGLELDALQEELARSAAAAPGWRPSWDRDVAIGGLFVASSTSGTDRCWVGACLVGAGGSMRSAVISGAPGAPYVPGRLALREGPLLERAAREIDAPLDVLLVNATGRDHPRGSGLAVHLGAVLDVPTVGVTDRPLVAEPAGEPGEDRGSWMPLELRGEVVGHLVRTRVAVRSVVVHAGWRTDPDTARSVVLAALGSARTPEPIRRARHLARLARAAAEGRLERR
jgi:deoxyribonuclease V